MTNDDKMFLLSKVKYQYVIEDPFPDHTNYQSIVGMLDKACSFFDLNKVKVEIPEPISIWKAYRMGEQAAIKRLEEALSYGKE